MVKLTLHVHNNTHQNVYVSPVGIVFGISRKLVKPEETRFIVIKPSLVTRYLGKSPPDVQTVVKAGEGRLKQRVRMRCDRQLFDIIHTSQYIFEARKRQENASEGFQMDITVHYAEEYLSSQKSLRCYMRGGPLRSLSMSSSGCSSYESRERDLVVSTAFSATFPPHLSMSRRWRGTSSSYNDLTDMVVGGLASSSKASITPQSSLDDSSRSGSFSVGFDLDNLRKFQQSKKILHRDDLLRQLNIGLNSHNPFAISQPTHPASHVNTNIDDPINAST